MEDNIWRQAAPDIVGPENRKLRIVIPLITALHQCEASLSVKEYEEAMSDFYGYSIPTIRKQLRRTMDLKYAFLHPDATDGRIKRIYPTLKAVRACRLASKLRALEFEHLLHLIGDDYGDIDQNARRVFDETIAYDVVSTINARRGRRKATV